MPKIKCEFCGKTKMTKKKARFCSATCIRKHWQKKMRDRRQKLKETKMAKGS